MNPHPYPLPAYREREVRPTHFASETLITAPSQLPTGAVFAAEILRHIRIGNILQRVACLVPFELFSGAIGDVSQQHRLGEGAGVSEVAERWRSIAATQQPFLVMAGRILDGFFRRNEIFEIC